MNKHILIVGGSGGIGSSLAMAYAKRGYAVTLTYHSNEQKARTCQEAVQAIGGQADIHLVDLRDEASVKNLFAGLTSLDVFAYPAATDNPKSVEEASYDDWREVTSVMIDGAFLCTKYAVPLLAKSDNPNILYFASTDGIRPNGEYLAYQVGEASLIAMTKGNAKYLATTYGIRVNAVCPGPVRTGLWDKVGGNTDQLWEDFAKQSPMKRVATPEDVARACLSVTEDPGKFLNGNLLFVDGFSGH